MLNPIIESVRDDFDAVNKALIDSLHSKIRLIDSLCHHIIDSGGKRIRPLLLLLVAKACNYQGNDHINMAVAIEYFHTATLLHDDVVDESDLRRGQETAHELFGTKASILVGDYLFTRTMDFTVNVSNDAINRLMAQTAHEITCGEIEQLDNRHNPDVDEAYYYAVIRCKTAILFACTTKIAAILGGLDEEQQNQLYDFGMHLGNAFQLIDDALDYYADQTLTGKNIGDDLNEGKPTLPLIHAMKHGNDEQRKLIRTCIRTGGINNIDAVLQTIADTGAIEATKKAAEQHIEAALNCLTCLPESEYRQHLHDIALFSIQRNH